MPDPLDQAALDASQSLDWRRVGEQLIPRYTQATFLASQAALSVALEAQQDATGRRLITHEQWWALMQQAFMLAFDNALEDLADEGPQAG